MRTPPDIRKPAARLRGQGGITLVELLVAIVIASILSTMMLVTWLALNNSYFYSVNSNNARDAGRQTLSRMEREVRDAELVPGTWTQPGLPPFQFSLKDEPMILRARPWTLVFTTTFNESGNADPGKVPHLVCYRLYYDGTTDKAELWRFEDKPNGAGVYDGRLSGLAFPSGDEPTTTGGRPNFNPSERTSGEGASLMMKNVVNTVSDFASPAELFTYYGYFGTSGSLLASHDVRLKEDRTVMRAVRIHLLIDLNPRRSPVYADLMTTAQLRNQRQF